MLKNMKKSIAALLVLLPNQKNRTMRKLLCILSAGALLGMAACKKDKAPEACINTAANTVENYEIVEFAPCELDGDSYEWNFGDGSKIVSSANVKHQFETPGTYTVTLTVKNSAGSSSATKAITVTDAPVLRFKFVFDSTLPRLDNLGNPEPIEAGHAAQSPQFNLIGAHYIELAPTMYTALGTGTVLFVGAETTEGGTKALDFDQEKLVSNNEQFFAIPLSKVAAGNYEWLRVSLAYQNYNITYRYNGVQYTGTLASFIGYNTYIRDYKIKNQKKSINANKLQGYWGFEESQYGYVVDGQVPSGAITVPNPLFATAPIPSGSCVVTGPFPAAFTVTGNETSDKTVVVKVSINNSFEWIDYGNDGFYDTSPGNLDVVTDMGVRGIYPEVQ